MSRTGWWRYSIGIIAVVALVVGGCAGTSLRTSSGGDESAAASGTFDDWVDAVCPPAFRYEGTSNPVIICNGYATGNDGFKSQIQVFDFRSQSDMQANRKLWDGEFGYATCRAEGQRIVVFKADVSGIGSRSAATEVAQRGIEPLAEFGCSIRPAGSPYQPIPQTPTQSPTVSAPSAPSSGAGGIALPANAYGYVAVQTKSGRTRCQIERSRVICETGENNWPAHGVEITADGSIRFADGNLGDIRPVTMQYRSYQAMGWTIAASSSGTRFTNDRTGHGAFVSVERVQAF